MLIGYGILFHLFYRFKCFFFKEVIIISTNNLISKYDKNDLSEK